MSHPDKLTNAGASTRHAIYIYERIYNVTFEKLGLIKPILKTLASQGYETPTPIQVQGIPIILEGRDVVGLAQTGTGKTAAFTLPLLQRLTEAGAPKGEYRPVRVLVLSPTRELAAQIEKNVKAYGEGLPLRSTCVVGGVPIKRQINALRRGVDILVATPGRLEDLVNQKAVRLNQIETIVLDEADQMLDIGFMPAIRRILKMLPKQRQTLLFSATMPKEIRSLSNDYLKDPAEVSVAVLSTTADRIDQSVIHMNAGDKVVQLVKLAKAHPGDRIIVFTRTKHGADKVVRKLKADNLGAAAIHGNKSQGQRQRALAAFRDGNTPILIATDIAARGIDIPGVEVVVNYELPEVPEAYVHRIGRTARAGASGLAVSFVAGDEVKRLRAVERLIKKSISASTADGSAVPTGTPKSSGDSAPRNSNNKNKRRRPQNGGKRRWHPARPKHGKAA